MDDLIPFLIVIVISIIGAAARKKKKRPFPESIVEGEPQRRNDDLLSWMERMVDDRPEPKPFFEVESDEDLVVEEMISEAPAENKNPFHAYNSFAGFISPEERKMMVDREAPRESTIEHEGEIATQPIKENEIGKTTIRSEFDLKKAVVFSTLLNRKYI